MMIIDPQGHAPSPAGQQGQQPPPGSQQWRRPPPGDTPSPPSTNGTAIAALIFSLVFAPVGIILGYLARSQIKRTGQGGRGLATAALIIAWIFTLAPIIIAAVTVAILLVTQSNDTHNQQPKPLTAVIETSPAH